jgi:hypothetical protein
MIYEHSSDHDPTCKFKCSLSLLAMALRAPKHLAVHFYPFHKGHPEYHASCIVTAISYIRIQTMT